jgi:trans-AT polyketide synthase, acyltransferase and oxidoreductase domains
MKNAYLVTQEKPIFNPKDFKNIIPYIRQPIYIVFDSLKKMFGLAKEGRIISEKKGSAFDLKGIIPALYPEWLGDRSFQETHNVRFSYVGGAMARGIASSDMVIELAKSGMLGFFGAAGLSVDNLEKEIIKIKNNLDKENLSWGSNLIHSPHDIELEEKIVDMYLKYGIRRISAAAFMKMSPNIVYYSSKGLYRDDKGIIRRKNYVFAKISRSEVALHFLSPAPSNILNSLVDKGKITSEEAELAKQVPVAEDITAEADSGGHTDNRPLNALFPIIADLRDRLSSKYQYKTRIRVGAAGSLGTPSAVSAAFALGASYVLLGSVHQSCVESGLCIEGKKLLAKADMADVMMTPSADMFELGVKVQVLKKGTLMGVRGSKLYDLYTRYNSIEDIPDNIRADIEKMIFQMPLNAVWKDTKEFFLKVEPLQVEKADKDPKYKMALIFRWYLGNSSKWAIIGEPERQMDYQIWCGPAIGAFNNWVKESFLEKPENRKIQQVALNLLEGASIITKAQQLRTYGIPVPSDIFAYKPVQIRI